MGHTTIRGNDGSYTPLLPSDTTVAAVLKKAGYVTGLVGKWGLGDVNTTGSPTAQGFDYFFGQDTQVGCHNWYPFDGTPEGGRLYRQSTPVTVAANEHASFATCGYDVGKCNWANDMYGQEAAKFITAHAGKDQPYFLYLSTTTPHEGTLGNVKGNPVPFDAGMGKFVDKDWPLPERNFSAAVWAQDLIVGQGIVSND